VSTGTHLGLRSDIPPKEQCMDSVRRSRDMAQGWQLARYGSWHDLTGEQSMDCAEVEAERADLCAWATRLDHHTRREMDCEVWSKSAQRDKRMTRYSGWSGS